MAEIPGPWRLDGARNPMLGWKDPETGQIRTEREGVKTTLQETYTFEHSQTEVVVYQSSESLAKAAR